MKTLLVIRHAKSSWGNALQRDFDRPLNERGHRDAPVMAQRMVDRGVEIDAFVTSTAERAFTTAAYFAAAYGVTKEQMVSVPELYHASAPVFFDAIIRLSDKLQTVALFSHNPGITSFVNELTTTQIDNMPTCAIFALQTDIASWKNFREASKSFWFFDYPKQKID